jgi:hypothetical protein
MENGQWTMDNGHWTMDIGQWTLDNGHWTFENGHWIMDIGHWTWDNGQWTMDIGQWTMEVVFHGGRLPWRSSPMEVVFLLSEIFQSSIIVDLKLLEIKFCSFQAVSSYFQLMRSSSIKDFFHGGPLPSDQHFFDCFEFQRSRPTTLRKQVMLFSSYFTTIPADGRAAGEINRIVFLSRALSIRRDVINRWQFIISIISFSHLMDQSEQSR